MKCPKCQADNPEGVKFCGECGQPFLVELTCSNCGHKTQPELNSATNVASLYLKPQPKLYPRQIQLSPPQPHSLTAAIKSRRHGEW
jgi:hypothetical protein